MLDGGCVVTERKARILNDEFEQLGLGAVGFRAVEDVRVAGEWL